MPPRDGDKEERGRILVIGGSREMPGACILAAIAALRAGAGKLCVATGLSVAPLVAQAIPEARVIGLPESEAGGLLTGDLERLPQTVDAVLIGPGMQDEKAAMAFVAAVLPRFATARIVLDATAMSVVMHDPVARRKYRDRPPRRPDESSFRFASPVLLTPHAGELAHLTADSKESICDDPESAAIAAAGRWNATVALKGAMTLVATPGSKMWRHTGGSIGLAISGSGDVLAGIIAGLAARGASLEQASVWGVALHALAGVSLEQRMGPLGFLAREISAEVPRLMRELG
jgi:hydroxyethylthiazole kinase-like uncharacterized protein yjeF